MSLEKSFYRNDIPVYPWYIADLVVTKKIGVVSHNHVINKTLFFNRQGMTEVWYERDSAEELGKWLLDKIIKDHNFYRRVIRNIYDYSKKLDGFGRHLNKLDPSQMSDKVLAKICLQYESQLKNLRVWGWVPPILDGMFESLLSDHILEKLGAFLKSKGKFEKLSEYYSLLSSSEKMSEVQKEHLARLRLLQKIKATRPDGYKAFIALKRGSEANWKKRFVTLSKLLDKHLKNFSWLTYAYAGPPMDSDYLLKTLGADLKEGSILRQIKSIENHFDTIKDKKKKLGIKLKLPADLKYLLRVSSELMFIKDYRKGIYQKSYVAMDPVISELAKRLEVSDRALKNLTLEEATAFLLSSRKSPAKRLTKDREKATAYVVKQGEIKLSSGYNAIRLFNKMTAGQSSGAKKDSVTEKQLTGLVAYPGSVRAKVKIVLKKQDIYKIKKGEILVSSATNPDLLTAMQKASAFITDTGGIICHAAIVARELKKPCVVGTKSATRVLKDGDMVEIDANHGIVKILKKFK